MRMTYRNVVRVLRAAVLSTGLGLGLTGIGLVSAPEAVALTGAGTAGYCPDGNGVTVVVDFQELGGGTVIRCAPGTSPPVSRR